MVAIEEENLRVERLVGSLGAGEIGEGLDPDQLLVPRGEHGEGVVATAFLVEKKHLARWHGIGSRVGLLKGIDEGGVTEGGVDLIGGNDFHGQDK